MTLTCHIFHQKDTFQDWTVEVNVNMVDQPCSIAWKLMCPSVVCPGEYDMSWWNKLPHLGHNPVYNPLHIPYKYPISPCCRQCVAGRYGCLDVTILTEYPPLGEDSNSKSPSFLQHLCPRYARWGIRWIGALSCCQSHLFNHFWSSATTSVWETRTY